jgi:hypothetical protein
VWVTDPQKYADAALHDRYLRRLNGHGDAMLMVLNQADRLDDAALRACRVFTTAFDGSALWTRDERSDALADAVGGTLVRQREALRDLGVDGARPPLALASSDPAAYLAGLAAASQAAELTARHGLGDFWWVVTDLP